MCVEDFQREIFNSCLMFIPADCSWKEVAEINESRYNASCTVFEGKIVVSGGFNNNGRLNSVEAYDHVSKSWTNMSNMINERSSHKSASVKNNLFLFEGDRYVTYQVYDSTSKKFVLLKSPGNRSLYCRLKFPDAVISIGSKLYIYHGRKSTCFIYDVENNTWSEEFFEVCRSISNFSFAKVPQW